MGPVRQRSVIALHELAQMDDHDVHVELKQRLMRRDENSLLKTEALGWLQSIVVQGRKPVGAKIREQQVLSKIRSIS